MHSRQQILDFIQARDLMVVSTIGHLGSPESAVVGFGETPDFELVFGTSDASRKALSIVANPLVAVVIGWDSGTIQYEGKARRLYGEELDHYAEYKFAKSPESRKHKSDPHEAYFLIEPKWLRYTDTSVYPWDITELTF